MSDNTNEIILEVKDLKKSFGDHVVLESINTTVRKGEVIAIIGPSGCGKSTFLRSLNLLETPTEGHVLFHEQDLTDKSVNVDELREKIGMVFQHFNLFPNMTIRRNITLAPTKLGLMSKDEADKKTGRLHRLFEKRKRKDENAAYIYDAFVKEIATDKRFSAEQKDFLMRCMEDGIAYEEIRRIARPELDVEMMERLANYYRKKIK